MYISRSRSSALFVGLGADANTSLIIVNARSSHQKQQYIIRNLKRVPETQACDFRMNSEVTDEHKINITGYNSAAAKSVNNRIII